MPAQWSMAIHALHIIVAGFVVIKWGDWQAQKLIILLTVYSLSGYWIVGQGLGVYGMMFCQALVILTCFLASKRWQGVAVMGIFIAMWFFGIFAIAGWITDSLWQGFSLNYWNYHSIMLHICILIGWLYPRGVDRYAYYTE